MSSVSDRIRAAAPVRRKRNIKNLGLPDEKAAPSSAPAALGKVATNGKVATSNATTDRFQYRGSASGNGLEIGVEVKLDLRQEDLKELKELGAGAGGTVSKVMHIPTRVVMAKKNIHVEMNDQSKKQVLRELQILHHCDSPYIVSFYGAFLSEPDVCTCMEFMDVGSLDYIYRKHGPIPIPVIGKVAVAVLNGLVYLYENHRIIHRDVKPSNILLNSSGAIKICDFGVSGVLINSVANTFVGTSNYMSPERIKGDPYTVKSDVWSLGLSLQELALGKFPFPEGLAIFELLQYIVNESVPSLPADKFPDDLVDLTKLCLVKDPQKRLTPKQLLLHPFVQTSVMDTIDLEEWAESLI